MGENRGYGDDGYPLVDLDSDDDCRPESSEDELDVILHGTPEQKRRLRRLSLGLQSSSEDEFEKEMAEELDKTMKNIADKQKLGISVTSRPKEKVQAAENKFYDNSYFDSDSDEDTSSQEKSTRQHPVISNDDLFYDPDIDNDNQLWVNKQRQRYQPRSALPDGRGRKMSGSRQDQMRPKPLPHSDAVLTCPACMSVLCLDCQRHTTYKNQYRAMFVKNCRIVTDERLRFPEEKKKSKKSRKRNKRVKVSDPSTEASGNNDGNMTTEAMDTSCPDSEMYNPVKCNICTTEVGVYDTDEVYHFFNVLASYG